MNQTSKDSESQSKFKNLVLFEEHKKTNFTPIPEEFFGKKTLYNDFSSSKTKLKSNANIHSSLRNSYQSPHYKSGNNFQ